MQFRQATFFSIDRCNKQRGHNFSALPSWDFRWTHFHKHKMEISAVQQLAVVTSCLEKKTKAVGEASLDG